MKSTTPVSDELEKKIVKLLSNGIRAGIIARNLEITEFRLAAILHEIRTKYECNNSTHLVAYFLRNKLIE